MTAELDKTVFTNALYALADVWADGTTVAYDVFLRALFKSITYWKEEEFDEEGELTTPLPPCVPYRSLPAVQRSVRRSVTWSQR